MRKLSTIHLKDAEVLNETQLKQICGGSGASPGTNEAKCGSITVTLANGEVLTADVSASVGCEGKCIVVDYSGVICIATGATMTCKDAKQQAYDKLVGGSGGSGSFA